MHHILGIKFCIYYSLLVFTKDLDMYRIDIERPVTSDETVILTEFIQGLHRAPQDI